MCPVKEIFSLSSQARCPFEKSSTRYVGPSRGPLDY